MVRASFINMLLLPTLTAHGLPQKVFLGQAPQEDKSYCAGFKTEAECTWAPEVRCSWDQTSGAGKCKCFKEDCKAFDLCALLSDNRSQCLDYSLPNGAKCKWGPSKDYPTANCTCEEEGCKTAMPKCSSEHACESDCQCVDGFCQPLPGCSQFSMDECEGQSANDAKCCLGSSTNASDLPCGFCYGSHPVCAAPTISLGSSPTALLSPVAQEYTSYCADFKTERDCTSGPEVGPEVLCSWDQTSGAGECKCFNEDCKASDSKKVTLTDPIATKTDFNLCVIPPYLTEWRCPNSDAACKEGEYCKETDNLRCYLASRIDIADSRKAGCSFKELKAAEKKVLALFAAGENNICEQKKKELGTCTLIEIKATCGTTEVITASESC